MPRSKRSRSSNITKTVPRSSSQEEVHADPIEFEEPPEPAPVSGISDREKDVGVSPGPSDQISVSLSVMSVEDENAEQRQKAQKKQKAKTHTHVTNKQQGEMVDWLKNHEVLYNKKLEGYKDTKKAFLWQQQAEVTGVDVSELKIGYTSLRTRFTKLRKKKSGDGDQEYSERDQWVLENFSFLALFTYEVKKRTLVSLKSKLPTPEPIDEDDPSSSSEQMASLGSDSQQQLSIGTTSRSTTPKPTHLFTSAISGKMDQFMNMQKSLMEQLVRPNTDQMKEAFIAYTRESVYDIHPALWEGMHRDIMKTVLTYKDRDSELKRAQPQSSTATPTTAPVEPSGSSSGWQPPPHMWPSTVQNPPSVWGSMDSAWMQQQFRQQFPEQQQQARQYFQPQQFFQPQQQRSLSKQQRQHDKHQDASPFSISQLTPLHTSTPLRDIGADTSFSSGLSSFLEGVQHQQQEAEQEEPHQEREEQQ